MRRCATHPRRHSPTLQSVPEVLSKCHVVARFVCLTALGPGQVRVSGVGQDAQGDELCAPECPHPRLPVPAQVHLQAPPAQAQPDRHGLCSRRRVRPPSQQADWPAKDRPICSPALSQPPMFMSPMFMPGREALAFVFCVARSVPARVSQCTPVHETVSQWHHQYFIVYSDCHHPWLVVSPRLLLCFFPGQAACTSRRYAHPIAVWTNQSAVF